MMIGAPDGDFLDDEAGARSSADDSVFIEPRNQTMAWEVSSGSRAGAAFVRAEKATCVSWRVAWTRSG